jgi:adenylosuccinate lyase
MPFGYSLLCVKSLMRGLNKITPNLVKLNKELESEPTIISEGIQTLLRDIGFPNPYEILRKITQTNHDITLSELKQQLLDELNSFQIKDNLEIPFDTIKKIENINQYNYLGSLF